MKTLVKRMVVMSTALILLCVCAVAQNEKSTKGGGTTYNYPTLKVTPNPVDLVSGAYAIVTITPDAGYYNPTIYYNDNSYKLDETFKSFEGEIFRVEPYGTNNPYSFKIVAKDVNKESEESISIDVEMIPEELWSLNRNMVRSTPATVIIKVSPEKTDKLNL